jgi:hypothetical protein
LLAGRVTGGEYGLNPRRVEEDPVNRSDVTGIPTLDRRCYGDVFKASF